ncbi:MAG: hypothetical protein KatS3mg059_1623 [Thermomicrobiales bacterium]|nr:MAG: hypothetical protein KatS3mg059_1623 [Thermomicrobiales bacterium]
MHHAPARGSTPALRRRTRLKPAGLTRMRANLSPLQGALLCGEPCPERSEGAGGEPRATGDTAH